MYSSYTQATPTSSFLNGGLLRWNGSKLYEDKIARRYFWAKKIAK